MLPGMGITPFAMGLRHRNISLTKGKAMKNRTIVQQMLAIALSLGTALGAMPSALAQGYSTYGPYPATPSLGPVQ
jgi:hypothetical protein